jgi:hypothetical protein
MAQVNSNFPALAAVSVGIIYMAYYTTHISQIQTNWMIIKLCKCEVKALVSFNGIFSTGKKCMITLSENVME